MIKYKTLNSRFRREKLTNTFLSSSKKLLVRAEQLELTTPSGYIKKSAFNDSKFKKVLNDYEQEYFEEKNNKNFSFKRDFESLVQQFITPSEYWQIMRNSNSGNEFVETIIYYINIYDTFEEDYRIEFEQWLYGEWYH